MTFNRVVCPECPECVIPFRVQDPFYSEANQRALAASVAQLDAGHGSERELLVPGDA